MYPHATYRSFPAIYLCSFALGMALCVSASAQMSRGGTGNSMGSSGFGGGMSSMGRSGMGSMMGGSGMGSMGLGGSGMGLGSGMGSGMGMGMGGMNSGFGSGMGGFGSMSLGGTGSSLGSTQGNQAFIGRDSADMTSVFNQLGRSSNQFFQQMNRNMGRGNRNRNRTQEENAVLPVRVRLDVAFDHPAVPHATSAAAIQGRLGKMLSRRKITAPDVEIVGETVVLRGVAASDSQRLLIEKLAAIEPGVIAVENQMTVASPAPAEQSPAVLPAPADN